MRMNLIPVHLSTNVRAAGYDLLSNTLYVQFKNGGMYEYSNVPQPLFQELTNGMAHPWTRTGKRIRQYRYRKIA